MLVQRFCLVFFVLLIFSHCDSLKKSDDDSQSTVIKKEYVDFCDSYTLISDGGTISGTQSECIEIAKDATVVFSGNVVFPKGTEFKINPGVTLKGKGYDTVSMVLIERGARINAQGTREKPITFTSDKPAGERGPQDWVGLIINGYGQINSGTERLGEGNTGFFGGEDNSDNSGIMKYVRIYFAGKFLPMQMAGLNLQGVGSGTTIHHVLVHRCDEDGIAVFGGSVNMNYIVSTANGDDQLDGTEGWQGKIQFTVLSVTTWYHEDYYQYSGDRAIELDNNEDKNEANPRTEISIYNMTAVSSVANKILHIRRGSKTVFRNLYTAYNSANTQNEDNCIVSDDPLSEVDFDYALLENCGPVGYLSKEDGEFNLGNNITNNNSIPTYINPDNYRSLSGLAAAGDTAFLPLTLKEGVTPPDDGFFDTSANFIGAIGEENWMAGWVEFPEN